MGERIELPQLPAGSEEQQMREMYSYLYRMAETMNHNLSEIGDMDLTDGERQAMQQILLFGESSGADGEYIPAYDWQGKESLKSLIIKTAAWVTNKLDEYRINLLGEYVADGKFGRYTRHTKLAVDITPEGIQQNFTFEEVVQGLKTYTINAKNYIRTGLLREVQGVPVYGVAVGKDIVTFSEDGEETYVDGNKVAEFTADELSFYNQQIKIASYTGDAITFYSNGKKLAELKPAELAFYQGADALGNELKVMSLTSSALNFNSAGKKLVELKPGELAFYQGADGQGNELKVMSLQSSELDFSSGGKKLVELKPGELAFYQGNELKVMSLKDSGLTFLSNEKKLAELKPGELAFYQGADQQGNELKVLSLQDSGLTFLSDGKKLAEMKPAGIVLYQGTDLQGNEIKVMELTGGGLEFYYNGVLRSKMDQYGTSFYNGIDLLAKLSGTALQFYQNGQVMAEFSAGDSQQQIPPVIYIRENIEMPSQVSDEKGITLESGNSKAEIDPLKIKLQSGNSYVLIDPSQINMNTDGLVSIKGNNNSIIRLIGSGSDDKIFQADASGGVLAKTIKSSEAEITEIEVTNLKVTGVLDAAIPIPNIVVSSTQPAAGNSTIWLEPVNGVITPFSYSKTVSDAQTGSWTTVQTGVQWRQTCTLASNIPATGAQKLKISGKMYKNGSTAAWAGTLTAVANVSGGNVSTINLGTVGSFPYMQSLRWDYGFSKEISIGSSITSGSITSITYTWTITNTTDTFAALSYPHDVTVTCTGETGSGSSDECTVHYIP